MKLFSFLKKKPDRRTEKKKVGDTGEALAAQYLEKKGYTILERNWVSGKKELDIVALYKNEVVFAEVKTTGSDRAESFKAPSEFVDLEKRRNLTDATREYVAYRKRIYPLHTEYYRFDVIEVFLNREKPEINHIENAFYREKGYKKK